MTYFLFFFSFSVGAGVAGAEEARPRDAGIEEFTTVASISGEGLSIEYLIFLPKLNKQLNVYARSDGNLR